MKKLNKLIGLRKEEFDKYIKPDDIKLKPQIYARPARLIPTHKTGDEMALSSIFLASLRLIKQFRDSIFKQIKFSKNGKLYFYTEVSFPEIIGIDKRIDGMIINVVSKSIKDVVFFEMKSSKNMLNKEQIESYIKIARTLKVNKLVTISNQFVSNINDSPIENIKVPASFNLFHFSWTNILTIAHILLFNNDDNITDIDQVEIMKEVTKYLEHSKSGLLGNTNMSEGWKLISEKIYKKERILKTDLLIKEAVKSWHQEERDLALLMSRSLGTSVKSSTKSKTSLKNDINKLLTKQILSGSLLIKNVVSKIDIILDFNRRLISMSVILNPPKDRKNNAKITYLFNQLEKCKKNEGLLYENLIENILIEPSFKFHKNHSNYSLTDLKNQDFRKFNDIQEFKIVNIKNLKGSFSSRSKFVNEIESMALKFYEGIVQHLSDWKKPTPKVDIFS